MSTSTSASTPVSGHTTTETENITLADEVKNYDTTGLISFLQGQDLGLDEEDLEIIRKEKVNGRAFLKITEEKLHSYGMPGGPASNLADFAKECKEKKL